MRATAGTINPVEPPSRRLFTWFGMYLKFYMRRHFHTIRIAHAARFPLDLDTLSGPLIIYINHPSWWDPLTCLLLARRLMPGADHYAPMDAAALEHYTFFRRMGLFPVEAGTRHGTIQFLQTAEDVLSRTNSVLWITPQGSFTDIRPRPLALKPGLGALLHRMPHALALPIALEYTYWDERLPEILVNVGELIQAIDIVPNTNDALQAGLARAQDELAGLAITRDASCFDTVLAGRAGVSGIYELWQRLRSRVHGEEYRHEHGSIHRQ